MQYLSERLNTQVALLLGALISQAALAQQAAAPAPPPDAPAAASATPQGSLSKSLGVFAFPAKNQDATQQSNDEAACYGWAKSQTNIDPMNIQPQAAPVPQVSDEQVANAGGGARARGAARGAAGGAIIGAVTGDAGTGAAAGAAAGALAGGAAKRQAKRDAAAAQQQQQAVAEQQAQASIAQQKATYVKAFSACLEGKGYTVK
ncbi:MAG: hypothetical protein JO299_10185 [Gammaproteobacteria bacterium]|nr:hypothetical protein [Gammaproteobacteria bacterium]